MNPVPRAREICIVRRPAGTSPEWVRDAWIGLVLPVRNTVPRKVRVCKPGHTPKGRLHGIGLALRGHSYLLEGYVVRSSDALAILAQAAPEAAAWIRENVPSLSLPRHHLVFDSKCCRYIGPESALLRWTRPPRLQSPGRMAAWLICDAVLHGLDALCFGYGVQRVGVEMLYLAAVPVLAALLAAAILRMRTASLRLLGAFITLDAAIRVGALVAKLAGPAGNEAVIDIMALAIQTAFMSHIVIDRLRGPANRFRRLAAVFVSATMIAAAPHLTDDTHVFWSASQTLRTMIGRSDPTDGEDEGPPPIEADRLWDAQPGLINAQIESLRPAPAGKPGGVVAMAIAPSGTLGLFGREAHAALQAAATRFGPAYRGGVLLSNAAADQLVVPLATRGTMAQTARAIGARDLGPNTTLFVYLVSHGGLDARLTSELSDYSSIQPISAQSTAQALAAPGITRRIIVVSACFAGSWIPALANDNTIIITAAARDRTSFGCADSHRLTAFGEAFLTELSSRTLSLHDAFERAKARIAGDETRTGLTPSQPQAWVGKAMMGQWLASP